MDADIGFLGPFGRLRPFSCLPGSISVERERPNYRGFTFDGGAYTQQTPRLARTWDWPIDVADRRTLAELEAVDGLVYGLPPFRWYDPWAVKLNMLPRGAATPGSTLDLDSVVWVESTTTVTSTPDPETFDGRPVVWAVDISEGGLVSAPGHDDVMDPVPVLEGRVYTFTTSGRKADGDPWAVGLLWVDSDGTGLSVDVATVSPDPEPQRAVLTATAPAGAHGVLAQVAAGEYGDVESVTMLQLTETDCPIDWYPGYGIPRVSLAEGYQEILHRISRSDACHDCEPNDLRGFTTLRLVEVGR